MHDLQGLATAWPGGKASRLYEVAVGHWKTKASSSALEKLGCAAASDHSLLTLPGFGLVTGLPEG